jgi:hypothetical protein
MDNKSFLIQSFMLLLKDRTKSRERRVRRERGGHDANEGR